jgi:hypothetical protein
VTLKRNVALSRGVSFTEYQAGDPCGSPTTNAPSSVGTQPSIESSGSVTTDPDLGVITSSCSPARVCDASRPLTSRLEIVKPRRSRLKRDKFCVAVAVITAVPVSWLPLGSQDSVRL